jgi:hypothetical protein
MRSSRPNYLEAASRLASLLEAIHWHYESTEMSRFVGNSASQVEIAAGFTQAELRAMVDAIQRGDVPIPASKPTVEPVTSPEPAPETRRALRSVKWRDHNGRKRYGMQFEDCDLTPAAAQRGLHCGAVVPLTDERHSRLRGSRGGEHVNPNAPDLLDLDDEAATRLPHIDPVMASDPVRTAKFTALDRSNEARKVQIAVPRL